MIHIRFPEPSDNMNTHKRLLPHSFIHQAPLAALSIAALIFINSSRSSPPCLTDKKNAFLESCRPAPALPDKKNARLELKNCVRQSRMSRCCWVIPREVWRYPVLLCRLCSPSAPTQLSIYDYGQRATVQCKGGRQTLCFRSLFRLWHRTICDLKKMKRYLRSLEYLMLRLNQCWLILPLGFRLMWTRL